MFALVQILGSLLVLAPFVLVQLGRLTSTSPLYLVLNIAGSGILAVDAALGAQWGFLLLEGTWAIVSLVGAMRLVRTRRRPRAHGTLGG